MRASKVPHTRDDLMTVVDAIEAMSARAKLARDTTRTFTPVCDIDWQL